MACLTILSSFLILAEDVGDLPDRTCHVTVETFTEICLTDLE